MRFTFLLGMNAKMPHERAEEIEFVLALPALQGPENGVDV
jgi:hypothetical protein